MHRRRIAAALALLCAAAAPAASAQDGLRLDLNIPENRLVVLDGGEVVRTYPVSVGLPDFATPTGDFRVQRAEWNPWWRPPEREWARDEKPTPPGPNNPMGRVKLFFAPYYYLHGTPAEGDLGQPASHGCVRLRNADAIELARLLHRRASATVAESAVDGILRRRSETRWVGFRAPVPLTIRYEPVVVRDGEVHVFPDFYGYGRIHSEAVVQALMAAGYDVASLDRGAVRDLLARARSERAPLSLSVGALLGRAALADRN